MSFGVELKQELLDIIEAGDEGRLLGAAVSILMHSVNPMVKEFGIDLHLYIASKFAEANQETKH
jgi:hypothetical protein